MSGEVLMKIFEVYGYSKIVNIGDIKLRVELREWAHIDLI